jgi:hypothetical protein
VYRRPKSPVGLTGVTSCLIQRARASLTACDVLNRLSEVCQRARVVLRPLAHRRIERQDAERPSRLARLCRTDSAQWVPPGRARGQRARPRSIFRALVCDSPNSCLTMDRCGWEGSVFFVVDAKNPSGRSWSLDSREGFVREAWPRGQYGRARCLVEMYASQGRSVSVPRPSCPCCSTPLRLWSGYPRSIRVGGRFVRVWVRRGHCRRYRRSHGLIPSFLLTGTKTRPDTLRISAWCSGRTMFVHWQGQVGSCPSGRVPEGYIGQRVAGRCGPTGAVAHVQVLSAVGRVTGGC